MSANGAHVIRAHLRSSLSQQLFCRPGDAAARSRLAAGTSAVASDDRRGDDLQGQAAELARPRFLGSGCTMRFVGKVWRLLVGVKDGLVLLLMLGFFGMLYAALSSSPKVPRGAHGALLLDLSGTIVEQPTVVAPLDVLRGSS